MCVVEAGVMTIAALAWLNVGALDQRLGGLTNQKTVLVSIDQSEASISKHRPMRDEY